MVFSFPIPQNALHMEIISSTLIEIGIKETWRALKPQWQEFEPVEMNIYDLVTQSQREDETIYEYDLLYIGSSKNVYNRLTKGHETILKIYRDMTSTRTNKEIFVWILKPKSHLYRQSLGELVTLTLSGSERLKDDMIGIDVDDEHLLAISEAMLINYFKPEYNEHYKNKMPSYSHAVYAKFRTAGVKHLQVNLNLFMQIYKDILYIKTESKNTGKAKHINLYAELENLIKKPEDSIVSVKILPEELYSLFIGG